VVEKGNVLCPTGVLLSETTQAETKARTDFGSMVWNEAEEATFEGGLSLPEADAGVEKGKEESIEGAEEKTSSTKSVLVEESTLFTVLFSVVDRPLA
jgi:hypothetical protein